MIYIYILYTYSTKFILKIYTKNEILGLIQPVAEEPMGTSSKNKNGGWTGSMLKTQTPLISIAYHWTKLSSLGIFGCWIILNSFLHTIMILKITPAAFQFHFIPCPYFPPRVVPPETEGTHGRHGQKMPRASESPRPPRALSLMSHRGIACQSGHLDPPKKIGHP